MAQIYAANSGHFRHFNPKWANNLKTFRTYVDRTLRENHDARRELIISGRLSNFICYCSVLKVDRIVAWIRQNRRINFLDYIPLVPCLSPIHCGKLHASERRIERKGAHDRRLCHAIWRIIRAPEPVHTKDSNCHLDRNTGSQLPHSDDAHCSLHNTMYGRFTFGTYSSEDGERPEKNKQTQSRTTQRRISRKINLGKKKMRTPIRIIASSILFSVCAVRLCRIQSPMINDFKISAMSLTGKSVCWRLSTLPFSPFLKSSAVFSFFRFSLCAAGAGLVSDAGSC